VLHSTYPVLQIDWQLSCAVSVANVEKNLPPSRTYLKL
jgi:hypothetical protein